MPTHFVDFKFTCVYNLVYRNIVVQQNVDSVVCIAVYKNGEKL